MLQYFLSMLQELQKITECNHEQEAKDLLEIYLVDLEIIAASEYGYDNQDIANKLENIGFYYKQLGDIAESEKYYRRAEEYKEYIIFDDTDGNKVYLTDNVEDYLKLLGE
ncbi:MAG TPA: hypothetical protein LFW21_04480 [Rickettsia endosymbiont of Pyrocoelia pectoralis]|nr:hypothetical protein [Rickettsia endosymbiont of Pyrocoelia pectoralis]